MDRPCIAEAMEAMEASTSSQSWVRGKLLGSGSFGRVNMAVSSSTGDLFAIKSVEVSEESAAKVNLRALENEVKLLAGLDSPYIVRYLGDSWSTEENDGMKATFRNLHLELAPGGSLAGLLKAAGSRGLAVELIRRYTRDLLQALSYLHSEGIVHGDVKCLNLLVGGSVVKLADFGTAYLAEGSTDQAKGLKGSPSWMSPETVKEQDDQGTAVDIWSLGCTVLEMATGKAPWCEVKGGAYGIMYALGCTDSLPSIPETLPAELKDLILSCLKRDPQERPTAAGLLCHPFFTKGQKASACFSPISLPQLWDDISSPISSPSASQSPKPVPSPSSQRHSLLSRFNRKRRLSCLSEEYHSSNCEDLPSPAQTSSCEGSSKRLKPCPSDLSTFEDSATPAFPLLDIALAKNPKPWCLSDCGAWPQSPLSSLGSKWIVVRSHSPELSPR